MPDHRDHDLERFVSAQNPAYAQVLGELHTGRKRSHWMWFIFPQIEGLGTGGTARHYSIKSADEARAYLAHPILGERLRECAGLLTAINGRTASEIFGYPDDLKFRSSLTLFAHVAAAEKLFTNLLAKYYGGKDDPRTVEILQGLAQMERAL